MKKTRREFMKEAIAGATGALLASAAACSPRQAQTAAAGDAGSEAPGPPQRAARRLILVRDREYASSGKVDPSRLQRQLHMAMSELSGAESQQAAWKAFFDPSDTVGLKVNCLSAPEMATHPQIAVAIARELRGIGLSRERVIVWDRERRELVAAGYDADIEDFRCLATDDEGIGHEEDIVLTGEVGASFSRILTSHCTATINMPLVKDHGIAGATCSLKNWLGAISNPNKLHHNQGDPMIADLNLAEAIRSKQRLIVCDALEVLYHGGPSYKPEYVARHGALIVGTDPVAMDTYAVKIIESERAKAKLPSLAREKRHPTYIARAADADHRLGDANLSKMQVVELTV